MFLLACVPQCKICFGQSDQSCVSCISPYILYGTTCVDKCPQKLFNNDGACVPCDPKCKDCTGNSTNCIGGCEDKYYLLNTNTCLKSCPEGYVENINRICVMCEEATSKCLYDLASGKTISIECLEGYFLFQKHCIKICDEGYYGKKSTKTCEKCDQACLVHLIKIYIILV